MHYYQFNIGDYASHTAHLDPIEDCAYRRMMDWYYLHESPLPESVEEIARAIRMREHCKCIASVLHEFFTLKDGRYFHKRIDSDIADYKSLSRKRKKAAKQRWANSGAVLSGDASALQVDSTSNANQKPETNNQEPVKTHTSPAGAGSIPDCPHQEIIDLYHKHCPTMPRVKVWNDKRRRALKARWRESPKHQSLDFWDAFLEYAGKSPFLRGETKPEWSASLEWIINPTNFAKIIEGNYHKGAQ